MSHEGLEHGRAALYNIAAHNLPTLYSDALRSVEFTQFFSEYHGASFEVQTADGWTWPSPIPHHPEFVARFRSRADLDAVISGASEATLARIFLNGTLDISGNIFCLLSVAEYAVLHSKAMSSGLLTTLNRLRGELAERLARMRSSSLRNWRDIYCPIDLPVSFFESWLGPSLGHGCASICSQQENLETAQENSLARACNWLNMSDRDRLLEIGCGWGTLSLYAASHCKGEVCGIASGQTQAACAMDRIYRSGAERHCSVEFRDLRKAPFPAGSFTKVADIGIFEQVSSGEWSKYLQCMKQMLTPGGRLLIHRVTPAHASKNARTSLSPGLPREPLSKELALAEESGWELLDVETLEKDYLDTLRIWIANLRQTNEKNASAPFTNAYRAWIFYLIEIATMLQSEELQVHRVLLKRSNLHAI